MITPLDRYAGLPAATRILFHKQLRHGNNPHVLALDLQGEGLRIQIDKSHGFFMQLPESEDFLKFRFEADAREAIQKIEK